MKKTVASVVSVFLMPCMVFGQPAESSQKNTAGGVLKSGSQKASMYARMSISELVSQIAGVKDVKNKSDIASELKTRVPSSKQEISMLFEVLEGTDPDQGGNERAISENIRRALYNIKDQSFGPEFAKRIKTGNFYVRGSAISMVANLKYEPAVPALVDLAERYGKAKDVHEEYLQVGAVAALGEIGDERAIPILIKQLGKMNGEEEQALARFGKKALPDLLRVMRKSKRDEEITSAGGAIRSMTDRSLVDIMWSVCQDEHDKARFAALDYLIINTDSSTTPSAGDLEAYVFKNFRKSRAFQYASLTIAKKTNNITFLLNVLGDNGNSAVIRETAIGYLGEIGSRSAVPALEAVLKDESEETRYLAAQALTRITGKEYNWRNP